MPDEPEQQKQRPDGSRDAMLPPDPPPAFGGKELGVPRLDHLLGGGVSRGTLLLVVGPPGSGKTTLANQIACAVAATDQRVITFTALSESTDKLVSHLRTFTFFDDQLLGGKWQIISLQQSLEVGMDATRTALVDITRRDHARLVVLDGFRGVRGISSDPQATRTFLYSVGTQLGILGITVIITSEADPRDPEFFAEATTADSIIGMHFGIEGVRQRRAIEVIKSRGSRSLSGLHGMQITERGIVIFPRLEAQIATSRNAPPVEAPSPASTLPVQEARARLDGRVGFGLPALDGLLNGGLTRATNSILIGGPGTGKTLLALQYALAGVRAGEHTIYVGMREDREQLLYTADQFAMGPDLRAALATGGSMTLQHWAPVELDPDEITMHLLTAIEHTGARRVVIDSLVEIERAIARSSDPGRVYDFLAALAVAMRERNVTALYVKEQHTPLVLELGAATAVIGALAENVLVLRHVSYRDRIRRVLSVAKMRFSAHESRLREFIIEAPTGIRVLDRPERDDSMLEQLATDQTSGGELPGRGRGGRQGARHTNAPATDATETP